jgi:hypothetical protein
MYSAKCCVVEAVFSAAILWDCGIDTKDNIFVFAVNLLHLTATVSRRQGVLEGRTYAPAGSYNVHQSQSSSDHSNN